MSALLIVLSVVACCAIALSPIFFAVADVRRNRELLSSDLELGAGLNNGVVTSSAVHGFSETALERIERSHRSQALASMSMRGWDWYY